MKALALLGFACLAWLSACTRPAVMLNAPPELDGAEVFVNEQKVGELKTSVYYRWTGLRGLRAETSAPPRHEANLSIPELREGSHNLRIAKRGYREYRGTFIYRGGHLELFIPDEAARKWPGSNSRLQRTRPATVVASALRFRVGRAAEAQVRWTDSDEQWFSRERNGFRTLFRDADSDKKS